MTLVAGARGGAHVSVPHHAASSWPGAAGAPPRSGAAEPAGRVADIGGPAVHEHTDLGRMYLAARKSRRRVVGVGAPGRIFAGYRSGANLVPDNSVGTVTFEEYLARAD